MRIFTLMLCLIFIACNDDKSKQIDNTNPKEQKTESTLQDSNTDKDSNDDITQSPHIAEDSGTAQDSSKEEDEKHKEKMKNIAGHYDARAYNGKGGYNAYQKKGVCH